MKEIRTRLLDRDIRQWWPDMRAGIAALLPVMMLFAGQAVTHAAEGGPLMRERSVNGYTVRFNAIESHHLSDNPMEQRMLERDRLPVSDGHGFVNVVVLESQEGLETRETVRADIDVTVRDVTGRRTPIEMKASTAQGMTSYVGGFEMDFDGPMSFIVDVRPGDERESWQLIFHRRFYRPAGS